MPAKIDQCVKSVLDENPSLSEEEAFAICNAQIDSKEDGDDDLTPTPLDESKLSRGELNGLVNEYEGYKQAEYDGVRYWLSVEDDLFVSEEMGDEDEKQEEEFAVDVFRVVQDEDTEQDLNGDLMGVGVDFPNSGVYVDWRTEAWSEDEQLEEPHVSDYGSVEDLEQATGGTVEPLDTIDANADTLDESDAEDEDGGDEEN